MNLANLNLSKLETALAASMDEHPFAGVIQIRQQGDVVYEQAAGYADRSNQRPNTLDTRFGIASGTKFFTALAIGKLIEAGKLTPLTRLRDCVTLDFPHYAEAITVQHLLTHTSGIPDYLDEEKIDDFENFTVGVPWYELRGPRDYLAVFPHEEMKFAPGDRFSYSNGGYILLGVIIEEVTGVRYQDFVTQEILRPLGMTRTGFFEMNKLPAETAFGYIEEDDGGWRTNIYNLPIVGASDGGIFATAAELSTLWNAFWHGRIVSPKLVEQFSAPFVQEASDDPHSYYGHGLWISNAPGDNGHTDRQHYTERQHYIVGSDAGVSFKSSVDSASGLEITVLSNTTHGAWPILRAIRDCI